MYRQIEDLKQTFAVKDITELKEIANDKGLKYSAQAIIAARELLLERDEPSDREELVLHFQRKNEKILGEVERKVGCLYTFMIFHIVASLLLGLTYFCIAGAN